MASSPGSSALKVCRYFVSGSCSKGSSCRYAHDRSLRDPNDVVCRFYVNGSCGYGTACRFDHVRPKHGDEKKAPKKKAPTKPPAPSQLVKPGLNVNAPEFVPSFKRAEKGVASYASAAGAAPLTEEQQLAKRALCPYFEMRGECSDYKCVFVHGEKCDMCSQFCLHPYNEEQRLSHSKECLENHELAMNEAFAAARSQEKFCGICMENIHENNLRFGILEGCKHCFCLTCIREWRSKNQTADFDTKVVRSCPECRQHSDFVVPSVIWLEEDDEKKLLIDMYQENTKGKICKYYMNKSAPGSCPFGNKCFYRHQLPDGSIDPGEDPHVRRVPRIADFIGMDDGDSDDDVDFEALLSAFTRALAR